jgi:multidrug efflux pump subunit AcrA (membrane-fusion protein)
LIEVAFIQKGDSVNMIPVQTGIQDDEYIYIKQGLQKGDRVVFHSAISRTLKQGDKVYEDKKDKTSDTKEEK